MTQTQLNALNIKAHRYLELKAMKAKIEKELEELDEVLRLATIDNDNEILGDTWKSKYTEYDKQSFSSKAFKEAEPDMYKLFVKPTHTQTFTIKSIA